jgi:hypothetical protein
MVCDTWVTVCNTSPPYPIMLATHNSSDLPFSAWPDITLSALMLPRLRLPLDAVRLAAGFPSPEDDYVEKRPNIN